MILTAEAQLELATGLNAKPSRVVGATAAMDVDFGVNVPQSALPGGPEKLVIKGEHAELAMKLILMLQAGEGDVKEVLEALRGLNDSDPVA